MSRGDVSVSVDWRRRGRKRLEGLRFVARTWGGETLDGVLSSRRIGPMTVMRDRDLGLDVIVLGRDGEENTLALHWHAINVTEEPIR